MEEENIPTPPEGPRYTQEEFLAIVNEQLIKDCKLDACIDKYLMSAKNEMEKKNKQDYYRRPTPGFDEDSTCQDLKKQLLDDIKHHVPEYFANEQDMALDNTGSKLRQRIDSRWRKWTSSPQKLETENGDFNKKLVQILSENRLRQISVQRDTGASEGPSSLQDGAFTEVCRQLRKLVEGENSSASFACGGTIPIGKDDNEHNSSCAPVNLFWKTGEDTQAQKLVLPLTDTQESNASLLQRLVDDCSPATFGRGDQDVLDPSYRMAGKLDTDKFASNFHPADFGILENVEQILLPSIRTDLENYLQFRKITAHLYKLNVYSGPSGLFRKHVDTPRSQNQIGSLVVCLPCEFKGGRLLVRHDGQEVDFDWASASTSTVQWAAFYSDCEHEIETVTEGHRITLTYNLHVTEAVGLSLLPNPVIDPKSLPLYEYVKGILENPAVLKEGGVLGFFCSYAYPHTAKYANEALPRSLKGSDLVLYSVFKSLGIFVKVVPVLELGGLYVPNDPQLGISGKTEKGQGYIRTFETNYEARKNLEKFRKLGYMESYLGYSGPPQRTGLELEYQDIGATLSDWDDIDRHWKTILLGRQVNGLSELEEVPGDYDDYHDYNEKPTGTRVGTRLHPYFTSDIGGEDMSEIEVEGVWPFYHLPGIIWLTEPKREEMAFTHLTYGNEASLDTRYSCAAIVAVIPPWNERMNERGNVPEQASSGEAEGSGSKRRKRAAGK
ncbi:hypothetical protein DTO164E3_5523 [Paecilomyces variotii]|nr:hypothetical protein DTO032I3_7976 [Paecilomyces variotii]KAJ9197669.1 hypothetical protein DTO164E3_5523 [Paecilomyces variotii]KAJ9225652.1 hypothetical protein DTO169C6_2088 [Paecilomyces variotii]KAJ9279353.1 hypothetical protein DTO021D3_3809 [Paecilomyces variotii]KAJ9291872.1 hypothetical protein DTO021C3_312 [Paecilomyces variotii]